MSADEPDRFHVKLVCGKARVTPLRGTTVPRSELSGFLILTRLLKVVVNSMDVKPSEVTIAVDSQCTISALEKSGGLLAPYFASRVSEAMSNLSDLAEETIVNAVQHVPGQLNPADIPTRDMTLPDEVRDGSVWQRGPDYLTLEKDEWPFSSQFLDAVPDQELRKPKAFFNVAVTGTWVSSLGSKLSKLIADVMCRSNSYDKTVNVTARLLKSLFDQNRERIQVTLEVRNIKLAKLVQFLVSMGPTFKAFDEGKLASLRPIVVGGIV